MAAAAGYNQPWISFAHQKFTGERISTSVRLFTTRLVGPDYILWESRSSICEICPPDGIFASWIALLRRDRAPPILVSPRPM